MARTGLDPVRFFSLLEILFLLESFLHRLVSTVDRSGLLIHRGLTQRIEVEWNFWIQIPMFRIEKRLKLFLSFFFENLNSSRCYTTPFTAYPRQCIQLFLIRISYVEILIFQDFDKNFVARREQG